MITSMTTPNEDERLLELYQYDLLDTAAEEDFDGIVQLASRLCNTPISTITLIDSHRQWFKAKVGISDSENPRELSFCAHVVADAEDLFTVTDASKDERFHDYPNVSGEPHIRFYAGVPLVTRRGHRIGALCVINSIPQDLTEEQAFALRILGHQVVKLAEQRLMNRYLKLYQAGMMKQAAMQNRILSIVAHDVRSPLVALQGIVELSEQELLTPEMRTSMLELWKKQLDNTMNLLSNLVEWGKLQAAGDMMSREPVNLHNMVQDELEKTRIAANEKKNELINYIDPKFLVAGDENVLRFIIRNILTNAIKFTENGQISIVAMRSKQRVSIIIADTGIGMTEEQKENLLQGKNVMVGLGTRSEKGSGLGFLLIKDFVEMHEGKISIDTARGKGTSIRIELNA